MCVTGRCQEDKPPDLRLRNFVTVVTYDRDRILVDAADLFHSSWSRVRPPAWVVMPDHFHAILDVGTSNISDIMHAFKIRFSRRYRDSVRPGRVWQNRFWDHVIRDEGDLESPLALLNKAEKLYYRNVVPECRPVAALKARV